MGAFISGHTFVNTKDRTVLRGNQFVKFHKNMTGKSITTVNGKCYIDGYELKNGKWKRTFMALWYLIF